MKSRASVKPFHRGWRGGVKPQLGPEGEALVAHTESCATCKEQTIIMTTCEEGRRLYAAFNDTFKGKPA